MRAVPRYELTQEAKHRHVFCDFWRSNTSVKAHLSARRDLYELVLNIFRTATCQFTTLTAVWTGLTQASTGTTVYVILHS